MPQRASWAVLSLFVSAPASSAQEVRPLLARDNAACLVREDGKLAGIITRYDVVQALTG